MLDASKMKLKYFLPVGMELALKKPSDCSSFLTLYLNEISVKDVDN